MHPEEFQKLFDTILINVTGFFRDKPSWDYLQETLIPQMLDAASASGAIRVWSSGCASGQEPYSLAILFAEAVGLEAFRQRVKIYATDVNESALAHARTGIYDLEKAYDELQSANEELETMNEELSEHEQRAAVDQPRAA